MIFPPDSRFGVPRDGVRFLDDPFNKHLASSDSGAWDYTDETGLLMRFASALAVGAE